MTVPILLVAALTLLTPPNGGRVSLLKGAQQAYFEMSRKARFFALEDADSRKGLLTTGGAQEPVHLTWACDAANCELTLHCEGGEEETYDINGTKGVWVTNLEPGRTYRWMVRTENGEVATASFETAATAPRFLRAEGARNFRDLGGWKTTAGRRVRLGRLFRAASYAPAGAKSSAALAGEFKIRTILDLEKGAPVPAGLREQVIPFVAYDSIDDVWRGREPFARIFATAADAANQPLLIRSLRGSDRAGTVAFLLLGLLGVGEEDLLKDWEASAFADADPKFTADRIRRLLKFLAGTGGKTLQDQIVRYAHECGIGDEQIAAFRLQMLE